MAMNGVGNSIFDVTALSDDELYERLRILGQPVGPIVDSTRSIYQRKLLTVLRSCGDSPQDITSQSSRLSHTESENRTMTTRRRTLPGPENSRGISVDRDVSFQEVTLESVNEESAKMAESPLILKRSQAEIEVECKTPTPVASRPTEGSPIPHFATPRQAMYSGSMRASPYRSSRTQEELALRLRAARLTRETENGHIEENNMVEKPPMKKNNSIFTTIIEIFVISFLLIVGYIFFQEIQSYSAAEKEYIESQAQNFHGSN